MSHAVTVKSKLLDGQYIEAACKAMGGTIAAETSVRFYDASDHEGIVLRLPGWDPTYGHVVVKDDGEIVFDNYEGTWGDAGDIGKLKQEYAFAEAEALYGEEWDVEREWMDDGNLKVTISQFE